MLHDPSNDPEALENLVTYEDILELQLNQAWSMVEVDGPPLNEALTYQKLREAFNQLMNQPMQVSPVMVTPKYFESKFLPDGQVMITYTPPVELKYVSVDLKIKVE